MVKTYLKILRFISAILVIAAGILMFFFIVKWIITPEDPIRQKSYCEKSAQDFQDYPELYKLNSIQAQMCWEKYHLKTR